MSNNIINKERKIFTRIYFEDDIGNKMEIKSPVLLSIFQSEKLLQLYKNDPEKKYSVKDIFNLRNKALPVKEPTIRHALNDNQIYFETSKDIEIRGSKGNKTVMVIIFTKLKPIVHYVFKAIEEMQKNDKK